jgi:hypothetical protein
MRSICALAVLLTLAACAGSGGWQKPGVTPSETAADYAECRHSAEVAHRRDSDIDADILATRGQDWERLGLLTIKRDDYADSDNARDKGLVERCMMAKGYTGG